MPASGIAPRRNLSLQKLLVSAIATIAVLATSAISAHAQVDVIASYLDEGTQFRYQFQVVNNTSEELSLVSLMVADVPFDVFNATAPPGFSILGSLVGDDGYVDFFQDLDDNTPQTFAPSSTVGYFRFYSTTFLPTFSVETLGALGGTTSGSITASAAAPEPATVGLLAIGLVGGLVLRRRQV